MAGKYPYRVIDADGHVVEPPNLWVERAETKYRERVIRWAPDKTGVSTVFTIDGRQMPPESKRMPSQLREFLKESEEKKYAEARAAGWDAASRLKDMDKEGIDTVVLFPSVAILGSGAPEDPTLAQTICRIYNDWLAEYCAADPRRLVGCCHTHTDIYNCPMQEKIGQRIWPAPAGRGACRWAPSVPHAAPA